MHRVRGFAAPLVVVLAIIAACADISRLPTSTTRLERLTPAVAHFSVLQATPVERKEALETDVTWSFTVGPDGAESENREVGLTIVIPPGALSTTETITATALAGSAVGYRFSPHIEFNERVQLVQDGLRIRGFQVGFAGAHFDGDGPDLSDGFALVSEVVPATISLLKGTVTIDVRHFSGWIVVSGSQPPPDSSSGSGP